MAREREKAAKRQEEKDRRPKAIAKYVRISPRKVKAVIDLIRGLNVQDAKAVLMNTPNGATEPVSSVLGSAIANVENNMNLSADTLFVAEAFADQGPTLKRFRPRARAGRPASANVRATLQLSWIRLSKEEYDGSGKYIRMVFGLGSSKTGTPGGQPKNPICRLHR